MAQISYLPSRYERKYLIGEETARAIREFARSHVEPDPYLRPDRPDGYPVFSLYLDSPRLSLYEATAQGLLNRFKLRVRFYDLNPANPVFFEIKRRLNQVVHKQRATLRRASLGRLLAGAAPCPSDLVRGTENGVAGRFGDLEEFCRLKSRLRAVGTLIVGYHREAYIDPLRGSTRVTFDRHLCARPYDPNEGLVVNMPPVTLPPGERPGVILELKYVSQFPAWMQQIVRRFGLERQSIPKYGWSIESIGEPLVVRSTQTQRWSRTERPVIVVRNGLHGAMQRNGKSTAHAPPTDTPSTP